MIFPLSLLLAIVPSNDIEAAVKRFVDVFAIVEKHAADPVNPSRAFYEGAIPGMLRRLDPHTVFFDPLQFEQLKELEKSTQKGFGTVVSVLPGRVIVLQTLPDAPSAKAGIIPGDEILAVNGIRLDRLDMDQLVGLLGQSRQQEAMLDVRRPGNARLLQFVLTPEDVESPSIDRAFLLEPGIGYVRATNFESETAGQLQHAIESLGGQSLKGLVLDLRNNPGGLLPPALQTAALFLETGKQILSVRGRAAKGEEITVPESKVRYEFPLAVLLNGKSASGSEIVAGAFQDHDRAVIVGEPSFGKGLVQSVYPLSQGTAMALTTAFYYTPSGRSIQRPLRGGQLRTESGKEYRTAAGRSVRGGGGIEPDRVVFPEPTTRLRMVLDATAAFTSFATDYLRRPGAKVTSDFPVTPALLDEFQLFLSQRNIRPGVSEWSAERDWIQNRLQQEILNQALGVEKGDEVEARRDPQVREAVRALGAG